MQNSNGQGTFQNSFLIVLSKDAKEASRLNNLISNRSLVFLEALEFHGTVSFVDAIQQISEIVLHCPTLPPSEELKDYLHDLKVLRDNLSELSKGDV